MFSDFFDLEAVIKIIPHQNKDDVSLVAMINFAESNCLYENHVSRQILL